MSASTTTSRRPVPPAVDTLLVEAATSPLRRFLPDTSTATWLTSLASRPDVTARRLAGLAAEATRIVVGTSDVEPRRGDRRFSDPGWTENPMLRRLVQLYLAGGRTAEQLVDDADLDPRDAKRVRFMVENIIEAVAPSNVPLVNPASAKAAIDSGGLSLLRGATQLAKDMTASPRVPEMVDGAKFQLGENVACTPGSVVFRNELLELIQYAPQTDEVYETPVLIVPPTINKYYAIDIAPGRSLVEFHVQNNRQVFVISWRNPDARHAAWDLETYVRGVLDALTTLEEISGHPQTTLVGICSGGILATVAAAYLARTGRMDRLAAMMLAVTVIDNNGAGVAEALVDPRLAALAKARSAKVGYLDGRSLAEVFAWLRPSDLIWSYWVNNYLLGKRPPAFDLLFWNSDTTRMPAGLHADFVDMAMGNLLTRGGEVEVFGERIDLRDITVDTYVLAGVADHITPWESCYQSTQLFGGECRFVLSTNGHVASLVNPPTNAKSSFHTNPDHGPDAVAWLTEAQRHEGSWWTDAVSWLDERSGSLVAAPKELGSVRLQPLVDAPGTYVFDK